MDSTADPCEDFFQYACGTWNKKHVIPEDRSSISTFEVTIFHPHYNYFMLINFVILCDVMRKIQKGSC